MFLQNTTTHPFIEPFKSNFSGQNVLITGAAQGLSKEMAISFVKAGVSGIAMLDILDATLVEPELLAAARMAGRSQPKLMSLKVDLTDEHAVAETAVIKESMRWRPVLPGGSSLGSTTQVENKCTDKTQGFPHSVTKDDVYEGYFIPNAAVIIPNQWAIFREEEKDPKQRPFSLSGG